MTHKYNQHEIVGMARDARSPARSERGKISATVAYLREYGGMWRVMDGRWARLDTRIDNQSARKKLTAAEREDRRAANDSRFRARLVASLKKQIAAVPVEAGPSARKALVERLSRIAPRATVPAYPGVLVRITSDAVYRLGWIQRGKDASYSIWRNPYQHVHAVGETEWRNGQPRHYTRAVNDTRLQSVAWDAPGGMLTVRCVGSRRRAQITIPGSTARIAPREALLSGDLIGISQDDGSITRYDHTGAVTGVSIPRPGYDGIWEHGADIAEARAELTHKAERAEMTHPSPGMRRAARLLCRGASLAATIDDARAAGHCRAGIEAWCRARDIDPATAVQIRTLYTDTDQRAQALALQVAIKAIVQRRAERARSSAA